MPLPFSIASRTHAIPAVPFEKCAAKTTTDKRAGTSVADHCTNVGRVGEVLSALLPECVKRLLPPAPGLPLSVHDVGDLFPTPVGMIRGAGQAFGKRVKISVLFD